MTHLDETTLDDWQLSYYFGKGGEVMSQIYDPEWNVIT